MSTAAYIADSMSRNSGRDQSAFILPVADNSDGTAEGAGEGNRFQHNDFHLLSSPLSTATGRENVEKDDYHDHCDDDLLLSSPVTDIQ